MWAMRTMVTYFLAVLDRCFLTRILYLDACKLPVRHPEPFAHQRHVHGRFFSYVRQRAREETPVRLPPVLQRAIPFPFFVGEPGIYLLVGPHLHLGRLDDAQGLSVPVKNDGLQADLGQRLSFGLVLP